MLHLMTWATDVNWFWNPPSAAVEIYSGATGFIVSCPRVLKPSASVLLIEPYVSLRRSIRIKKRLSLECCEK